MMEMKKRKLVSEPPTPGPEPGKGIPSNLPIPNGPSAWVPPQVLEELLFLHCLALSFGLQGAGRSGWIVPNRWLKLLEMIFFLFIKSELIPFDIFPSSEGWVKRVIAAGGNNGNNTNRLLREQEHSGPQICPLEGKRVGQLLLLAFPLHGIHRITRG